MSKQNDTTPLRIAMYQPDIPQNLGAMMWLCACAGVALDIIEPCGFPLDSKKIKKSGMDYLSEIKYTRHSSWTNFTEAQKGRIILMTTQASTPYIDFDFKPGDALLAGSESTGAPPEVHEYADARIMIPMCGQTRSLNIVNATSMILGEALRQTTWAKETEI